MLRRNVFLGTRKIVSQNTVYVLLAYITGNGQLGLGREHFLFIQDRAGQECVDSNFSDIYSILHVVFQDEHGKPVQLQVRLHYRRVSTRVRSR